MRGLSSRAVLSSAAQTIIIYLYLLDSDGVNSIVLVTYTVSTVLELWKVFKVLRIMRMQRRAAAARRQSAVASAASVSATLGSRPRLTLAEPGSVGTERGGTDVETDAERP